MLRYSSTSLLVLFVVWTVVLFPGQAHAQASDEPKLAQRLVNMYIDNVFANIEIFQSELPDLFPFIEQNLLSQIEAGLIPPFVLSQAVGSQVSSFPLGSSAGGFSWTFDPNLGTFNRVSESFGPVFAERALTVGRNRVNVGVNVQRATFDHLGDRSLADGDIKTYFGSVVPAGAPVSQVFIEDSLALNVSTTTVGLFATYGVTSRLDVGVAIPIVNVDMDARFTSRFGVDDELDPEPFFEGEAVQGSASGIGDIVLRGKYIVWPAEGGGVAAGVDFRLPTGDEENWLGVAGSQTKIYVAASTAYGRLSPHFNFGYTFSGESSAAKDDDVPVFAPANEVTYAGGVDASLTPRLTIVGDLLGRTLLDFGDLEDQPSIFGASFPELAFREEGNLNLLLGSIGVKYNVLGSSLVSLNVLFPLNDSGLRDSLTWVVGFEQSFGFRR